MTTIDKHPSQDNERIILDSLRRIVGVLRSSSTVAEKTSHLSGAQLFVLQQLADGKALSINQLAALTLTHQSSVSVVVRKLATKGMIVREISSNDARKLKVSLTLAGKNCLRRAPETVQKKLISALKYLTPPQKESLSKLMRAWIRAAKLEKSPTPMFFENVTEKKGGMPK